MAPQDNTWELGTRAHRDHQAHPMLAVRDGAGWQAGAAEGGAVGGRLPHSTRSCLLTTQSCPERLAW